MSRDLKAYRRKRDFSKTAEPLGTDSTTSGNRFVVHKHHATADHYDLRLEIGGVLKSWAVPKGPSLNPADKRLAVATEDHPIDYLDFEGVIPEGEYGGGPIIVWDTGVWAPMEDVDGSLRKGAFKFRLSGDKLKGGWMLARLKPRAGEDDKNWILFKERDPFADATTDILEARPESAKTGRAIEELVAKPKPVSRAAKFNPGKIKGAVAGPPPSRVPPQLASPMATPPNGPDWLHEIKFDGYRTAAHITGGATRLITRSGLDWTHRYADLPAALSKLPCRDAILDGEIVATDEKGIPRLAALQDALANGAAKKLIFYAFDLLYLDGWDLRNAELGDRKELMTRLLSQSVKASSAIQISEHVQGDGEAFFERASEMGLEGIVSKRISSPYQSDRSKTWLKAKALQVGDFVIAGYTVSQAAEGLASLALAEWVDGELEYRGKVGTGFDSETLDTLTARLEPLRGDAQPLEGAPRDVIWVRPILSVRVHYGARTTDNLLRHSVFKGLREVEFSSEAAPERKRLISDADLATIWVTNPTRRLFGRSGPTKLDIAVYYAAVGDFMLPHLLGRPVSLFRCPTGKPQDCFFQRHPFSGMPATIASFDTKNSEGETKGYISVEDVKGYLALAQFGVVEFHTWGTLRKNLDRPDRVVFDLDPGEGIDWREVVEAAVHVRGELQQLGLEPFVKTSGGKGIHVVVPTTRKLGWKLFHQAASEISARIAATAPTVFTTVMGKENRKKRIFIDFHRNARGATAAAPYTLRGRPHMPASTPLKWGDLESIDAPEDLNYSSLPGLLERTGDPWADINDFARELPPPIQVKR